MKISLILCLLFCSVLALAKDIKHLRVVWHEDPAHEAYILWTTDKLKRKSRIYFDTVPRKGNLKAYRYSIKAKVRPYTLTLTWRHGAKIVGLKPSTKYYFVVKTKNEVSQEYHFITGPVDNRPFKLMFGGDSRTDVKKRQQINRFLAKTLADDPSILGLVHGGDYVSLGISWKQWDQWLSDYELTITEKGRVLPIVPIRGNHELLSPLFNDVFAHPGAPRNNYFRTRFGELSIINLNTNASHAGRQKCWLKDTLKAATQDSKWIVANYHRPAFPAVKKPGKARKHWVPLFEKHQIDLAFESDGHTLKRTAPIYANAVNKEKGIVYVGEGGLGVKLRQPSKDKEWYFQAPGYTASEYHVMILDVTPQQMELSIVKPDGVEFDRFAVKPRRGKSELLAKK